MPSTAVEPPEPAPSFAREAPLSRGTIWVLCLVATPLVGAILYYAWRKKYPVAARYANRVSWLTWLLWLAVSVVFWVVQMQRLE
jgi:hypothetical protein